MAEVMTIHWLNIKTHQQKYQSYVMKLIVMAMNTVCFIKHQEIICKVIGVLNVSEASKKQKNNVAIECQGEQHYRPFEAFGGERRMLQTKTRDKIKFELCSLNCVKILYFTNKMTILENNDIYTKENTFKSLDELFSKIV